MRTLLLPGMDGTGRLFRGLLEQLPPELSPEVVAYPPKRVASYEELLARLPLSGEPVRLVAESFSGPLAILAAASHPEVTALVLVASFTRFPGNPIARALAKWAPAALFRLPPPALAISRLLVGADAPESLVAEVRAALAEVAPEVLAHRLRQVCTVDVEGALAALRIPILYLAGTRDRLVGAGGVPRLRRIHPAIEVVSLDAPHLVLQRRPAEAAKAILEFFDRADTPRSAHG